MKKFLLSLAAVVLAGVSAFANEYTYAISELDDFKDVTSGSKAVDSFTAGDFTITFSGSGTKTSYYANGGAIRVYAKNTITIKAAEGVKMSKISTTVTGSFTKATLTANVGTISSNYPFEWTAGDIAELPNEVAITLGSSGQFRFATITITTEEGADKTDAGLAFASETINANLGEAVPANVLTKATDAAAVYTSSNEEVATVDAATGEVTLVAAGTTTIKATTAATDTYKAGEASYTLVVVDPNAKKEANLAFANATITVDVAETAPANELTKDTDAAVVYTSSNEEVATVDAATGALTLVGEGTTTIKAAAEATDNYEAGEAIYTLTVTDKAAIVYENDCKTEDCGFTFEFGDGENPWTISSSYGLTGNAYNISGKTADAYAVSPVYDLSNRVKPITMTQTFAYNYVTVDQIPEYFTIAVREEGATDWTVLMAAPAPEAMNRWTYVDDYTIDLNEYEGKKIQIGYRYVADGTVCGGWQIKDVLVKAKQKSAVSDIVVEDTDAPVVYYNLQGVRVENPANGLYIRVQGKKATKVLVR